MRNTLLILTLGGFLAVGATTAVFAQDNSAPPAQQEGQGHHRGRMDPNRQLEHMTKELDLTADQQNQIKPILLDRQQKMEALRQNGSASRDDRRSQMMAIRQDANGRIEAVLNDQQKQKFEAMQQRMQERMQQHRGDQAPGADSQAPPTTQPQPQ